MKTKKVYKDPFYSGTDCYVWIMHNCERCWKQSKDDTPIEKVRCSIERDILIRMVEDVPIKQETIDVCSRADCPYRQEVRPKYKSKKKMQEESLF